MKPTIKRHLQQFSLGASSPPPAFFVLQTCYGLTAAQIAARIGRSRSMLTYYMDGRQAMPEDVQQALKDMVTEGMDTIKGMAPSDPTHRRMVAAIWDLSRTLLKEWDHLMG